MTLTFMSDLVLIPPYQQGNISRGYYAGSATVCSYVRQYVSTSPVSDCMT